MKKNYSFVVNFPCDSMEEVLDALIGHNNKHNQIPRIISNNALVKVNAGDGIGFNTEDFVIVTNVKHDVGMLIKASRNKFEQHEKLIVNQHPVTNKNNLKAGHTYLLKNSNGEYAFVKYLGHSMVLGRCKDSCDTFKIHGAVIPPHYELSVPVEY